MSKKITPVELEEVPFGEGDEEVDDRKKTAACSGGLGWWKIHCLLWQYMVYPLVRVFGMDRRLWGNQPRLAAMLRRKDFTQAARFLRNHRDCLDGEWAGVSSLLLIVVHVLPRIAGEAPDDEGVELLKLALDMGADPNYIPSRSNHSAVHFCSTGESLEILKLLLESGGRVDIPCRRGLLPIMSAAYHGPPDVIKLLVSCGADINCATESGWTPLMSACLKDNSAVVEFLLKEGVDICSKYSKTEETAMHASRGDSTAIAASDFSVISV